MLTKEKIKARAEEKKEEVKSEMRAKMGCGDVQEKVHDDYDFLNKDD